MSRTVAKNLDSDVSIIGVSPSQTRGDLVVDRPFPGCDRCSVCDSYVVRTFEGLCLGCNVGMPELMTPTSLRILLGLCAVTECDDEATTKATVDGEFPVLVCLAHAVSVYAPRLRRMGGSLQPIGR